jgi:hypothetical protein
MCVVLTDLFDGTRCAQVWLDILAQQVQDQAATHRREGNVGFTVVNMQVASRNSHWVGSVVLI